VLLAVSLYIRLRMSESPLFARLKSEGRVSKNPLKESFGQSRRTSASSSSPSSGPRPAGRRLVHGAVLRPHLPAEAAEPGLASGLRAGGRGPVPWGRRSSSYSVPSPTASAASGSCSAGACSPPSPTFRSTTA
jgi:hypothetical protein